MKIIKIISLLIAVAVYTAGGGNAYSQSWGSIATQNGLTADRMCSTDGTDITCDSPNPEILSGGVISATGISVTGVITATTFYGDGSNLTGVGASIDTLNDINDVDTSGQTTGAILRFDGTSWTTVSDLSTAISTTTMVDGWPDAIKCKYNPDGRYRILYLRQSHDTNNIQYADLVDSNSEREYIQYNDDATYNSAYNYTNFDCATNSWSISDLYTQGRAFNFLGNNGAQISLTHIADVSATAVADGEALVWNDAQNRWIPGSAGGTTIDTLNDINDVDTSGQTTGAILRFDGTSWTTVSDLSTAISTTSMVVNWPDAIKCNAGSSTRLLYLQYKGTGQVTYIQISPSASNYVNFAPATGNYLESTGMSGYNCITNTWSITDLYSNGQAFNYLGNNGTQISLTHIADVSATAVADGEALVWNDTSGNWEPDTCPAGFTEIGAAGEVLGCMQTDEEGSSTLTGAINSCFTTYGGRLPSSAEWYASMNNYALSNEADNWERLDGYAASQDSVLVGNGSISSFSHGSGTVDRPYRCWLPR